MKIHAAAVRNAKEYDKRKKTETMPPDVEAVWPEYKTYQPKHFKIKPLVMKDVKKHQGRMVLIADVEYSFNLCREIWQVHQDRGTLVSILADDYGLSKMVIHSILQKGQHGKLTVKNVRS